MKHTLFLKINARFSLRQYSLLICFFSLLMLAGCTSSYNSQKNWNRTPASTGRNRCGCLLNPATEHSIKLYQQYIYALQA